GDPWPGVLQDPPEVAPNRWWPAMDAVGLTARLWPLRSRCTATTRATRRRGPINSRSDHCSRKSPVPRPTALITCGFGATHIHGGSDMMLRFATALLLCVVVAGPWSGLALARQQNDIITMGYSNIAGGELPVWVAVDQGYFARHGVNV